MCSIMGYCGVCDDLEAFQKVGRHSDRNHAERQGSACVPRGREYLWCDTLTHKHHAMRVILHRLMAM